MTRSGHRCVLIRHGETEWSLTGRHTGRTDVPLLPEGVEGAKALRPVMAAYQFAAVLTSPLQRARDTCALAGLGEQALVEPDLCEWDYGSYDGITTAEIRRERPTWDLFADGAPGGETAAQVGARVDRVIARVRAVKGNVACVAHSHVLRVLAARWIGLDPTGGRSFVLAPAAFSEVGWEREYPVVHRWNHR